MNDPFESYKLYNALKLHFESNYDAVKYNFKSNVTTNSFLKRKDKYFFAKLAKKYNGNLRDFYVSQFVNNGKYVGDMLDSEAEQNFKHFKKVQESIHRTFEVDINKLCDYDLEQLLISEDGQHPLIIKLWMQEEILLETVVILNSILGFIPRESKKIKDTIIWPDQKRLIEKYTPFVKFDANKIKLICKKAFTKP
jgi:hypothetical protein